MLVFVPSQVCAHSVDDRNGLRGVGYVREVGVVTCVLTEDSQESLLLVMVHLSHCDHWKSRRKACSSCFENSLNLALLYLRSQYWTKVRLHSAWYLFTGISYTYLAFKGLIQMPIHPTSFSNYPSFTDNSRNLFSYKYLLTSYHPYSLICISLL